MSAPQKRRRLGDTAAGHRRRREPHDPEPQGAPAPSHWERLPTELRHRVLACANTITRLSVGWLTAGDIARMDGQAHQRVWAEAFECDWRGNLRLLPDVPLDDRTLWAVRSPRMLARLRSDHTHQCSASALVQAAILNRVDSVLRRTAVPDMCDLAAQCGAVWLLDELVLHRKALRLTRSARLDYAEWAAASGHTNVVLWLRQHWPGDAWPSEVLARAVGSGSMSLVRFLVVDCGMIPQPSSADLAAKFGLLQVLDFLRSRGLTTVSPRALDLAAGNGHLAVVRRLAELAAPCSAKALDDAAANGHLAVVQWLHANRAEGGTSDAMDYAARNGHLEVVQWLHANRAEGCTKFALDSSAEHGHLEVVKWLHANRSEGCSTVAMDWAAANGHLAVVEFLHHNRSEGCTTVAFDLASANGHLNVVEFLHNNRSEGGSTEAMDMAAKNGHLDVVMFLHNNRAEGCTSRAKYGAAKHGHLDVVKFLHRNRTEGSITTAIKFAKAASKRDVVEWLRQQSSSMPECFDAVE